MNSIYSIFLYLRSFITFIFFGPLILLVIFIYPSALYSLIIPFCRLMIWMFGCKLKIKGTFPDDKNFVIMANHVSFLDVFAIPSCFKGKFSAVAASMNFKIPVYATLLRKLKVVSINRSNKEEAIKSIKKAEKVLSSGYSIVILPEGTRTLDGKLSDFKKGGFHLAKNTGADILPIITRGLFNIKPKNRWNIKPGIIEINIMKPINSHNKTIEKLMNETQKVFSNHFKR